MNRFTEWLTTGRVSEFKRAEVTNSRVSLPRATPLDFTLPSLGRYATRSELVYACIEKKAQAATDPELIVQTKTSKGEWETVKEHRALDVLKDPNPGDSGESFLRTWIASDNIAAVFYAEIVRNRLGEPINLYPLRADYMFPQYIETGRGPILDYYSYQINGYEVRFKPEELLIHRRHGRSSMFSGLSPLQVALASVDADIAATEYVRDFFNNDGTPSGILKVTGKNLSDTDAQSLKQKWTATYSRNGKGRGGIAILDESATYETVGARLDELNSETLTSIDETRICMAFGVPPALIGAYVGLKNVNQRASFKGAQEEFWMNTMSPELKAIRNFLTQKFLTLYEDPEKVKRGEIRFFWDMSTVDALQEDIDAIHDRVALGYKTGIYKLNEAREQVGLDAVDGEEGEAFYKPTAQFGEPVDEPKQLTDGKSILDATTLEKKTEDFAFRRELTVAEQTVDIKAIFDSYENGTKELAKVVADIRRMLIDQAVKAVRSVDDADIHTLTLSPPKNAYKLVEKPVRRAFQEGIGQIRQQRLIGKGVDPSGIIQTTIFIETKGIVDDLIQRLVELTVSRIINEVSTAAANIITSLGVLGYARERIEEEIELELDERSEKPFEGIARQAVNAALNMGRREEMKAREDEIDYYEYSGILDTKICDPCEEWDGKQSRNLDDLPETPNDECEGGANCRCFVVAVFSDEAQ